MALAGVVGRRAEEQDMVDLRDLKQCERRPLGGAGRRGRAPRGATGRGRSAGSETVREAAARRCRYTVRGNIGPARFETEYQVAPPSRLSTRRVQSQHTDPATGKKIIFVHFLRSLA